MSMLDAGDLEVIKDVVRQMISKALAEQPPAYKFDALQNMVQQMIRDALAERSRPFKIFGLDGTRDYAERVARHLNKDLSPHIEKAFEDGECYVKPDDNGEGNVRGHSVFVIQSLYSDNDESVSDKFLKLCMMSGALRDASAHEVIAIVPHLGWARQDRKTESRAPISTKYVAQMLEAVGVSRCLFIDVHNLSAEQNAFRIPIDVLETKNLHAQWCAERLRGAKKIRVLSPDSGGLARAIRFRNALAWILGRAHEDDISICIFDKTRIKGVVRGARVVGDVEDAEVVVYDDMISTGGTMEKACRAVIAAGGRVAAICAAHGLFCGNANEVFQDLDTTLLVADTVAPFRLNETNLEKVEVIDTTRMVADAILRIHSYTGSINALLELPRH